MAYNTEELEKKALEAIEKYKLFFTEDVIAYLPCVRQTFYEHNLDKSEPIKKALWENKILVKVGLRKKWYEGKNPLTQMALYKLIGTEEEYHRIANTKQDIKEDSNRTVKIEYVNRPTDTTE